MHVPAAPVRRLPHPSRLQRAGLFAAPIAAALPFLAPLPGLEAAGRRMLAIFLVAIILWVTEAIPLVATALLVILGEVLLLSEQALVPLTTPVIGSAEVFASLADPVIVLFLGGFLIADGAAVYGLDQRLAGVLLRPFLGGGARRTVLGLMLITAVLSMFVSNTATTATMFAVLVPVLVALPAGPARTGLALSVPIAANIGGIGTPVGSPPNAIALGALTAQGHGVSFVGWMMLAVPLMLVMLGVAWWLLATRFIPPTLRVELDLRAPSDHSPAARLFAVIAGATVLLWLTEPLHGIASSTVGFVPVVLLLATGVMGAADLRNLQWHVLWLVAGGIALGAGIGASGLDEWLLGLVAWSSIPATVVLALLVLVGLAFSTVISSSAAANLLVPLALSLATGVDLEPVLVGVTIALACALAMSLPISTPPNAIAYATGEVPTRAMATTGILIGTVGATLLIAAMPSLWRWAGLL